MPRDAILDLSARTQVALLFERHPLHASPGIEWRNYRTTAGTAEYQRGVISLSRSLIIDEERLRDTILHEYAHLLAFQRFGVKGKGHGPAWREAMAELGAEPEVRHQYECQRNEKRQIVIYRCIRCGKQIQRRRRLPRRTTFVHLKCGGRIKFLESVVATPQPSLS